MTVAFLSTTLMSSFVLPSFRELVALLTIVNSRTHVRNGWSSLIVTYC